jgi:hypothetical protein
MRRPIDIVTLFGAAILQLVLATGASRGLILCVEPDGRSRIESVFVEECCNESRGGHDGDRLACDCRDIPIFDAAVSAPSSTRPDYDLRANAGAEVLSSALSLCPSPDHVRGRPRAADPPWRDLAVRRSIVLIV